MHEESQPRHLAVPEPYGRVLRERDELAKRLADAELALAIARRWVRPTLVPGCVYLNSPILTAEESRVLLGGASDA